MSEPEDIISPITCEYDNCGGFAEAACWLHVEPVGLMLCRNHTHIIDNHKTVCPDCLAAAGAVE